MAVKKDVKKWAIKIRGRSFLLDDCGQPQILQSQMVAQIFAKITRENEGISAEAVRVRVRIEEIE